MGDIYCFKLSPLLSFQCQEVFEDGKIQRQFCLWGEQKSLGSKVAQGPLFSPGSCRVPLGDRAPGGLELGSEPGPGPRPSANVWAQIAERGGTRTLGKFQPPRMFVEECV